MFAARLADSGLIYSAVFLFAGAVNALGGQSSQVDNPKRLLLEVRRTVMLTIERLPKYMCMETVDRTTFRPQEEIANESCDDLTNRKRQQNPVRVRKYTADRLRLDVAISSNDEMYSWAGENHFQDKSLAALVHGGATSTGTFAMFLRAIFAEDAASFTFNGEVPNHAPRLVEYGFRIPLAKSHYLIGNGDSRATVAYDGTFWVDPVSANLVRLLVRAEQLPQELHICDSTTELEYAVTHLNNAEFLLPAEVEWHIVSANGNELQNRTVFSGCHEFRGESSLSFSPVDNGPQAMHEARPGPTALPAGLPFIIALSNPIEVARAAAGDPVKCRMISPLRKGRGRVLIPKGAVISGRILRLERIYPGASETVKLAIKLETVEVNGAPQPFYAHLDSLIEKRSILPAPPASTPLKTRQELGTFGEMVDSSDASAGVVEFEEVSDDYVIPRGLQISGVTASAE